MRLITHCALCGDSEGPWVMVPEYAVCYDCIGSLVENEIEDRGVKEEARRFGEYHGGDSMPEDRERQQLRDAGRIP